MTLDLLPHRPINGFDFSFDSIGSGDDQIAALRFNNGLLTGIETAGRGALTLNQHLQIHGSDFYQLQTYPGDGTSFTSTFALEAPVIAAIPEPFHLGNDDPWLYWYQLPDLWPQEPDNRSSYLIAGRCHSVLEFRQVQPIGVSKPAEISERTARSFALLALDLC